MKSKRKENNKRRVWVRLANIMACTLVLTLGVATMVQAVSLWQHFEPHLAPCLLNHCLQAHVWREYSYFGLDVFCTIFCLLIAVDMGKAIFCENATNTGSKPQ